MYSAWQFWVPNFSSAPGGTKISTKCSICYTECVGFTMALVFTTWSEMSGVCIFFCCFLHHLHQDIKSFSTWRNGSGMKENILLPELTTVYWWEFLSSTWGWNMQSSRTHRGVKIEAKDTTYILSSGPGIFRPSEHLYNIPEEAGKFIPVLT